MTSVTQRFGEAMAQPGANHSGDADPTRHVGNAAVPTDSRGTRVYKESKHSTRRIDLAVCAIMAHAAAISGNAEQQVWCSRRRHETTPWAVSDRAPTVWLAREFEFGWHQIDLHAITSLDSGFVRSGLVRCPAALALAWRVSTGPQGV